jgi:hypothetical protein
MTPTYTSLPGSSAISAIGPSGIDTNPLSPVPNSPSVVQSTAGGHKRHISLSLDTGSPPLPQRRTTTFETEDALEMFVPRAADAPSPR